MTRVIIRSLGQLMLRRKKRHVFRMGDLRTSNLVEDGVASVTCAMMSKVRVIMSLSSVWCMFVHNWTTKSRRNTKINRNCPCHSWHSAPFPKSKGQRPVTRQLNDVTKNQPLRKALVYGWSTMTRITDVRGDLKGQGYNVTSSVWSVFTHNSTKRSPRSTKIGRKIATGEKARTSSKAKMVVITRPLWVAVQVTTCRGNVNVM